MPDADPSSILIQLRSSAIHGSVAFATRALKPGTVIGTYAGRRYSPDEVAERDWDHVLTFVFGLSDGSVIDGAEGGNATRHINHSCAPNCVAYEVETDAGGAWIEIEALDHIGPGAELCLDYRLDVGDGEPEDFGCCYGASACRGTLVGVAMPG